MSRFRKLLHELHQRSLWQVLGIYLVAGFAAFEVVQTLVEGLGLPEWFPAFALILLILGLPVVLATAFVQGGVPGRARAPTLEELDRIIPDGSRGDSTPSRRVLTWKNVVGGGVAAFALWGVVAAAWLLLGDPPTRGEAGRASLAVLPFVNMSGEEANAPFTAGIHDDILTQLSKIASLKVISRTSVLEYRDRAVSIREIARELDVATVLEGGVQRSGDRVRINAQLIDGTTDEHLWAETFDRELTAENVFAVQSEIAQEIAAALEARLTPEERERIESRATDDLEAYDLYVSGLHSLNTGLDYEAGRDYFERAIERDPEFAVAWAWLSEAYSHLDRPAEAKAAAERALELDPSLAAAHLARAFVLMFNEWDWPAAERALDRALALNPSHALAFQRRAYTYAALGRHDDAIADIERAFTLDPLSPRIQIDRGILRWNARRYDRAERDIRRAVEMEPNNRSFRWYLAMIHLWQGRRDEAALEFDSIDAPLDAAIARADTAEALDLLASREGDPAGADPIDMAAAYTAIGERDSALRWLERAYDERHRLTAFLGVSPWWDALRGDPRFQDLIDRIGLGASPVDGTAGPGR